MSNRLVLFDCDGTLLDSQALIVAAMQQAFGDGGLDLPSAEAVRHVVGLSLPEAIARLAAHLPNKQVNGLTEAYKAAYFELRTDPAAQDRLYDGMADLLSALGQGNYLLGVATGKSTRGLHGVLQKYDLHHHFITLQTADDHPSKPHPSMIERAMADAGATPGSTVMIGDTSYDMQMAVAAGAVPLGVAWGYHPVSQLRRSGAISVSDDSAALYQAIKTALGEVDDDR